LDDIAPPLPNDEGQLLAFDIAIPNSIGSTAIRKQAAEQAWSASTISPSWSASEGHGGLARWEIAPFWLTPRPSY